ncbi:MAG: hypothetical protein H6Q90_5134 [Deltaproteobacteria bacterium]|nr:hypothetical protein [Deltaproteobacteria bacterium]
MRAIVLRGKGIDIRSYEIASAECIVAELQPVTISLLAEARAVLDAILSSQDDRPADEPAIEREDESSSIWASHLPFEREIDAAVANNLGSRHAVDEIAFIAQLELRQREDRLSRIKPTQGVVALLGECDSSLRRIRKALNAVDAAIARAASVPALLDFTSELQTSLAVRRAYAKFRARIVGDGMPTEATLRARFRATGTQIAILVGWDVYPEMRVQDRLLLREFQQRILAWLRGGPEASPTAGIRLWQDLAASIEMFSLVNRRQELVAHDGGAVRALFGKGEQLEVDAATLQAVGSLEGLDPELDQLVVGPQPPAADRLVAIVARLAIQLGVSGVAPSGGSSW